MSRAPALTEPAAAAAAAALPAAGADRFAILDGWRAASILLVLAGHLLPLGPAQLGLNEAVAATGMVLFFILSGFLITRFLAAHADLRVFLIRRFFRIVPLAWTVMLVLLIAARAPPATWAASFLFYINIPPYHFVPGDGPLWSLCVEMQFYLGIALFVALLGQRALIALPLVAGAVTVARIVAHEPISIVTWHRVDEILAGGVVALVYAGWYGEAPKRVLAAINPLWLLPLLVASGHHATGPLQYARPYIAALTIGSSLYGAPAVLQRLFTNRAAAYIATVSYALYIFHGALVDTWLGSGGKLAKYAKRPLLLGLTFGLAHLSTFRFEQPCVQLAKRWTRGLTVKIPA